MAQGSIQPLTNMSNMDVFWGLKEEGA